MALTDGSGTVALANLRLEEMLGYQHGELIGRPVESLVPADLRAAHRGHRAAYAQEPRARPMGAGARLVALRKDGTTFPAEISLSPVTTATGTFTLTVVRDVTQARRLADLADLARATAAAQQAHDSQELLDSSHHQLVQGRAQPANRRGPVPRRGPSAISEALQRLDDTIGQIRDSAFTTLDQKPTHPAPRNAAKRPVTHDGYDPGK